MSDWSEERRRRLQGLVSVLQGNPDYFAQVHGIDKHEDAVAIAAALEEIDKLQAQNDRAMKWLSENGERQDLRIKELAREAEFLQAEMRAREQYYRDRLADNGVSE